jgi:hypothetical protein
MISSLCREVDENCTILRYYAACSGNSLPTFRNNLSGPSSRVKKLDFLSLEDRTDRLSRNVGKDLPLYAAYYPRREQISKENVGCIKVGFQFLAVHYQLWPGNCIQAATRKYVVCKCTHEILLNGKQYKL